jgi:DNA-binding GntR family transcriptional regulator
MLAIKKARLSRTMRGDLVSIIQDEILGKKFKPGERVKEEDICEELGISRTPVREALAVLAQQGLVVQTPHRGTVVATFTPQEIVDLLRVEYAVEGMAASLAARNRTEEQLNALEALTESVRSSLTEHFDSDAFFNYDRKFHFKLVECTGSPMIVRIVETQLTLIYLCRYYTITAPHRFSHSVREHKEIIDCLRRSDAECAEKAVRKHVRSVISDYESAAAGRAKEDIGGQG